MWKLDQLTQKARSIFKFPIPDDKNILVYIIEIITAGGRGGEELSPGQAFYIRQAEIKEWGLTITPEMREGSKWQIDNFNELLSSWASQILQLFHTPIVWITIYIKPLVFVTACLWSVCQSLCPGAQKGAFSSSFICNERVAQHERCLAFQLIRILFWKISFSQTFVNFLSGLETFAIFRIY